MTVPGWMRRAVAVGRESTVVFLADVGRGLLDLSHSVLAMVGLAVVGAALFLTGQPALRDSIETQAWGWLQQRHLAHTGADDAAALADADPPASGLSALASATTADPSTLTKPQANVTLWIARRYHVAPEPVARLVQEAWAMGRRTGLEPTTILAVMAVESSFNPFAQSPVGAQGLMQVMTRVHNDKYVPFGGRLAAFDPVTNLRVGVEVLKECITKGGGLETGLRYYVGAAGSEDDGGYAMKVISEAHYLQRVAAGQNVSPYVAPVLTAAAPAPAPAAASMPAPSAVRHEPAASAAARDGTTTAAAAAQAPAPVAMSAQNDGVSDRPLALAR